MQNETLFERRNHWITNSISVKLASIGVLIILLLIPMSMIKSLILERQDTRSNAINEVSGKWGNAQSVTGLVLTIPYKHHYKSQQDKGEVKYYVTKKRAYFLPKQLNISGVVNPEIRNRGIYDIVVYQTDLTINGSFSKVDFSDWNIADKDVYWEEAFVSIGISDMRGIQNNIRLDWNSNEYDFEPGTKITKMLSSGVNANVLIDSEIENYQFEFNLVLNGSKDLSFTPMGKTTNVQLTSSWANPSFNGSFLPDSREVTENGFSANWKILNLNRNFPQKWKEESLGFYQSNFGVNLLIPVDQYQKSIRSAKYATLFIGLTFMIFFFIEVKNKKKIHPVQYILVGLALCVFYILLISLSEHINFNLAYILASIGVIGVIVSYAKSVFENNKLTLVLSGVLVLLYSFLYVIIREQDYSLLIGSVSLFVILAFVMQMSKDINWYESLEKKQELE